MAHGRVDEARAALAEIVTRWPREAAFAQTLLPWALGEPGVDPVKLRAAIADAPPGEATNYFIARQDIDGYNAYIEALGAIPQQDDFLDLYANRSAGHAMLRDPRGQGDSRALRLPALLARKRLARRMPSAWRDRFRMRR